MEAPKSVHWDPEASGASPSAYSTSAEDSAESLGSKSPGEAESRRCPWMCSCSCGRREGDREGACFLLNFLLDVLNGLSQVCFFANPRAGIIFLLAVLLGSPRAAIVLSILGGLSSTATALCLGLDKEARREGLLGYNGVLVGCSFSVFIGNFLLGLILTVLVAGLTPLVFVGIGRMLKSQLTFAYNLVSLITISCVHMWVAQHGGSDGDDHGKDVFSWSCCFSALAGSNSVKATLNGVAQMFFVSSPISGVLVTLGICLASPFSALVSLLGSCIGALFGAMCGGIAFEIQEGFFGYNGALIALWISLRYSEQGYLFVTSLAGVGATAATAVYAGLRLAVVASNGVFPCALTVPLVSVAFLFIATEQFVNAVAARCSQSRENCTDAMAQP